MKTRRAYQLGAALGGVAVLVCGGTVPARANGNAAERLARAETLVREEMRTQRIPGLAIAIISGGKVVLARGLGYANVEHEVPVTVDTVFQSGSVGKQFTAAAVMLFVEDGKLSLDDPITKFLPEARPEWNAIHIRHLLTHTSGIADYTEQDFDLRRAWTEEEEVRMACALPLNFQPGERFSYSNTGYLLLGAIIDRLGGRHYSEVLRDRVFKPLGMKSARLIDESAIVMHRAAGYRFLNGHLANQEWVAPEINITADGSLYLSIQDMIAWDRGLREGKILSAKSWREVFTPATLNSGNPYPYGFGWDVSTINGRRYVAHDGAWQGFETHISRYLDDELSIIVLTNLAEADPARIAHRVAGVLRDDLRPRARRPIADDEPLRRTALEELLQRARAGALTAADLPHLRGEFQPSNATEYRSEFDGLGDLQTLVLVERDRLGDDEHSEYLANFEHGRRIVTYTVDPEGGTVGLDIDLAD